MGARRMRTIRVVVAIIAAIVVTAGVVMPLALVSEDPAVGSPTQLIGP